MPFLERAPGILARGSRRLLPRRGGGDSEAATCQLERMIHFLERDCLLSVGSNTYEKNSYSTLNTTRGLFLYDRLCRFFGEEGKQVSNSKREFFGFRIIFCKSLCKNFEYSVRGWKRMGERDKSGDYRMGYEKESCRDKHG